MLTVRRTVRTGFAKSILFAWLALALLAGPVAKPAFAAEPPSACPNREAVAIAVRALLRPSHVDTAGIEAQFEVQDFGDRYAVTVKGRRRDYTDEPRDCTKRAHVAAVFVALTLAPPDIPLPEKPDPAPGSSSSTPSSSSASSSTSASASASSPAPAPPASASPSPSPSPSLPPTPPLWSFHLELGALALLAPRTDASQSALGAELRCSVLRDAWGLTLGAHVATSSTLELDGVSVNESRVPFDLGFRRHFRSLQLQGSLELGLAAALTRLRQDGVASAQSETRVELGARAAGRLALNSTLSPYLSVFTQVFPFRQQLAVEPRGPVGQPSLVWLGAALGVAAKFP